MNIALTAFTRRGAALAKALAEALEADGHSCALACQEKLRDILPGAEIYERLGRWAGDGPYCGSRATCREVP